jgi:tetratricopeptide (TPR) repeat protein
MRSLLATLLIATTAAAQTPPAPVAEPVPQPAAPAPVVPATDEFSKAVFFGKKFFEMKDYAAAYQQFAKADTLQADHPAVLYNMALLLAKAGRYSEATAKLDRYNQLYPTGAERQYVAKLQLELEFQRELQKKRQSDQDYSDLFTRGRFLYAKNDLDAALKLFQDAEQKRPNDPAAVYNQAVIYEKVGDFARAIDRYHRFAELENAAEHKAGTDQHVLMLESELSDMRTKIVCGFCGLKLPIGATWCPRCWHGPYLTSSAIWNSRTCVEGASATRATYYSEDRFAKNDTLACMYPGTMLEALRYAPAKQRTIQDARKGEGWTYDGDIIQGWRDKQGNEIRYFQGPEMLERIVSTTGDILNFAGHKAGELYLLDREDQIVDNQKYTSRYTFDANDRVTQQRVEYQNGAGCNHVITMTADYVYEGETLTGAKVKGGYDGYVAEGSPHTEWLVNVSFAYDAAGRLAKEDLAVASMLKMYTKKAIGNYREEISRLYPSMRVNRPIENVLRTGDLCATNGNLLLGNPIDLRPFYLISPSAAFVVPYGIAKSSVTFTYPESFKLVRP